HRGSSITRASKRARSLLELVGPQIDFPFCLVLGVTVTRLKKAEQFDALAVDAFDIVISQLAPLRPNLALELIPVSFDDIPVHESLLLVDFGYRSAAERTGLPPPFTEPLRGAEN